MTNPIIQIHNVETGEVIEREMTADEFKQHKKTQKEETERLAKKELEAEAKLIAQAKLTALGLTVEDLQALGL